MQDEKRKVISVFWLSPQTGCMFVFIVISAVVCFPMISFFDFSDSRTRGAGIFRFFQSISYGGIPVGAILLSLFLLYESTKFGWRWADRIGIKATDDEIKFHKSIWFKPLGWDEIETISLIRKKRRLVKELKPSLFLRYRRSQTGLKTKIIPGLDWKEGGGKAFVELAKNKGKWRVSDP